MTKFLTTIKARIKRGAAVYQDFGFGDWPACKPPGGGTEAADPDMEFECTRQRGGWDCVAPGFGQRGDYGNGSIFVCDLQGVEAVEESSPMTTGPYILRSNLITALRIAIKEQTELERRARYTGKSALLAGLEANLAALEAGLPMEVR